MSFRKDVQIKRPGAASFAWWHCDTRLGEYTFTPTVPGVYAFRARLRRVKTQKTSMFSPPAGVTIS